MSLPVIFIAAVDHKDMRNYPDVGDWQFLSDGVLLVRVTRTGDSRSDFALAVHEVVEAILCLKNGISGKVVDDFDVQFEAEREDGKHAKDALAGDDPSAPYHTEHVQATTVEMEVVRALGLSWLQHEKNITALDG